MRILRVHNRYQQRGGEDVCFEAECRLLREHGEEVATPEVSNDEIPASRSALGAARLAGTTIWSPSGRARVAAAVRETGADVVHFDNTFPLVSPAAYAAARAGGAVVVQTLHNYRLMCPAATLLRDGAPCEDCVGRRVPLPAVAHGCYHDSRHQTAVVAGMLGFHAIRRTWTRDVDRYIALTGFAKRKFVEHGIPEAMIAVKPNFVADRPSGGMRQPGTFLFVGRLAPEKGISTLIEAAAIAGDAACIRIAGDGPLLDAIGDAATTIPGLHILGRQPPQAVQAGMRACQALVFPSVWYEGFPMTILEAFASGLPVIASRLGSMPEIVEDGRTGLLFEAGNAADLAARLAWAREHPDAMAAMGTRARATWEALYTPQRNYRLLMDIYREALETAPSRPRATVAS